MTTVLAALFGLMLIGVPVALVNFGGDGLPRHVRN